MFVRTIIVNTYRIPAMLDSASTAHPEYQALRLDRSGRCVLRYEISQSTSRGVQSGPLVSTISCGQAETATTQSISARKTT